MKYMLYVPAPGVPHDIRAGSAIVGEEQDGLVDTHYEGGGASNVQTYEQRMHQAASRRVTNYPTSARRAWRPEDLVRVGTAVHSPGLRHWIVDAIEDEAALRDWIGPEDGVKPGGSDKLFQDEAGKLFSDLPNRDQVRIASMRLPPAALGAEIVATFERMTRDPE